MKVFRIFGTIISPKLSYSLEIKRENQWSEKGAHKITFFDIYSGMT